MSIKFVIYGSLPNLNDYTKACRSNKHVGAKMKRTAQEVCCWSIATQCRGKHMDSCNVVIKWIEKDKRRDPDNIAFAKKFILDSLVAQKVLSNDGWTQVKSLTDYFDVDKLNPRIEVTLIEPNG